MRGRTTLMTMLVGTLLLGACGDDDSPSVTEPAAISTTGSAAVTSPPATPPATVAVAAHATLGSLLVGPNGHTLYLFTKDQGTTSACSGGCAANWPALKVTGTPVAGDGVDSAKLTVAGGQVVYNGHLLYFFSGDTAPGDAKGAAIPNWFALNPAGEKIEPTGDGTYQ